MSNGSFRNPDNAFLLSLGSNIGDRLSYLRNAIRELCVHKHIQLSRFSPIYETEPVGFTEQPLFLNMAVSGTSWLEPEQLFKICKEIELKLGRNTRPKWHEREIDIDLLIFGNRIISTSELTIPHPQMHLRMFVLLPASQIEPVAIHCVLKKTIAQLIAECNDSSGVKLFSGSTNTFF